MGDQDTEQIYKVNAFFGLYLYKKPLKSDTNRILRMENGSIVTRVNDQVQTGSKLEWYNVRYIDDEHDEVGWAPVEYLELQVIEQPPTDNPPAQSPPSGSSKPKVAPVTNVRYQTTKKLAKAFLRSMPPDVPLGPVTYNYGGDQSTSLAGWNAAAAPNSKLKVGKG